MKCQKFLLVLLQISFLLYSVNADDYQKKEFKMRKWFSKSLFLRAKHKFERSELLNNQANLFISRANRLISGDKDQGTVEKYSDESGLANAVDTKFGKQEELNNFGKALTGYFLGESINKLEKGFPKAHAHQLLECIHGAYSSAVKSENKQVHKQFNDDIIGINLKIKPEHVTPVGEFFTNMAKAVKEKDEKQAQALAKDEKIIKFCDMAIIPINEIAKYVLKGGYYKQCHVDNRTDKKQSLLERKLEDKENKDQLSTNACQVPTEKFITPMIKKPVLLTSFQTLWTELIVKGFIEKKWDEILWNPVFKAAGQLNAAVIRPVCKQRMKKSFLKKWEKRITK